MTIRQITARVGVGAGAAVVLLAAATVWLVLSDPLAVATAVGQRDASPLVMAVVKLLGRALVRIVFGR